MLLLYLERILGKNVEKLLGLKVCYEKEKANPSSEDSMVDLTKVKLHICNRLQF